jgi:hypothetical protein
MIDSTPASAPPPRRAALRIFFVAGPLLLVGGIVAIIIDTAVISQNNAIGGTIRLQTLPVFKYTVSQSPTLNHDVANYQLMPVFLVVASLGLLLVISAIALRAALLRRS